MRIFLVSSDNLPIALISHDYLRGLYCCRSKNESFRRAFDINVQPLHKFVKSGNDTNMVSSEITDYDWIDPIIKKLSNDKWFFKELDLKENMSSFEELVDTHLS